MTKIVPNGKVHPVAALFPMMSDEELGELAADIKENGLLTAIVLDEDGTLIDGRNRSAACELAGIKPIYEQLNGPDPVAFIMSSNDRRRHMKLGQRAMIAAKVRALMNNSSTTREVSKRAEVDQSYIARAAVILEYASEQAEGVISGAISLMDAYAEAQKRKKAVASEEGRMQRLRENAPDLAALVGEDRMSLSEAVGAMSAREQEAMDQARLVDQERQLATSHLEQIVSSLALPNWSVEQMAENYLSLYDLKHARSEITPEILATCADVLRKLSQNWNQKSVTKKPKK